MKTIYLDCRSGVAGDMLLAGLVDAGAPLEEVRASVEALGVGGWELSTSETTRAGIRALRLEVEREPDPPARTLSDVRALIEAAPLHAAVAERASKAFGILAAAEAKVHAVSLQDVHFHEIGAIDAIVDIVGCCAAFAHLDADRILCSPLPSGGGRAEAAHGSLPIPAPAVLEILKGVPLYGAGEHELVTPTGAALVVTHCSSFGPLPGMRIEAIGYGAGGRDIPAAPNVLRVLVGEAIEAVGSDEQLVIETNVDDMSPELLPHVVEALIAAGAADAWWTPIVMKKGRPAFTISSLCADADRDRVLDVLFRETTTFGARVSAIEKIALTREWVEVTVEGTAMRVKVARRGGEVVTVSPEHDDALLVARTTGMPLKDVYARALAAYEAVRTE